MKEKNRQTTDAKPALQSSMEAKIPPPRHCPRSASESGNPVTPSMTVSRLWSAPPFPMFRASAATAGAMKASWITSASALDGGRLQMEHRWREHRHIRVVTIVRPEVGAVEFLARLERDDETQA